MKLARLLLFVSAWMFLGLGVAFVVNPQGMAGGIEIVLPTATARTDLMATYGGIELGLGVFLLLCWRRREWLGAGLMLNGLVFAGLGSTRLLGMAQAGFAVHSMMFWFVVIETVVAVLSFWGARVAGREGVRP